MNKFLIRRLRIVLSLLCFVLITLLLLDFSGVLHKYFGFLAKIQFLPAVMALNFGVIVFFVLVTLVLGRTYCSVVCPLGIFQDVISRLHSFKAKNRFKYRKEKAVLRYTVWVLFILAMVMGVNSFVALLAPYSSWGRMVQNLFSPFYLWINNILAYFAERFNSYAFYSQEVWIRSLPTFLIALVSFLIIGFLAWKNGREYCNSICPVGTTLSFFAKFSFLKMNIDREKCISCDKCTKNCKANCINGKENIVDYSRCVMCGDCMAVCPKGAIRYSHLKAKTTTSSNEKGKSEVDISKRAFVTSSALLLGSAALAQEKKKIDGGLAVIEEKKPYVRRNSVVPPGAKSSDNFYSKCTGCQLCVSKCPNNVLRPSKDLLHLMQPEMSFEKGACRVECNICSQVCPAGAIEPVEKEDKTSIQIGKAVWVKDNCVVLKNGHQCGNCARHCPAGAIFMVDYENKDKALQGKDSASQGKDTDKLKIPSVNESRCIGCGMCEYVCPSRPFSAIYVEGRQVHSNV